MADLVPTVTHETDPVTWDAAGVINALNAKTWGAAWSVADHNVGQGTALKCDTAGENFSINFRKKNASTAIIMVSISPVEPFEDAGNDTPTAPTTTGAAAMGADWSTEWEWDVTVGTPATGSKFWVHEYPDAIALLFTDPTNAFYPHLALLGRIYQPHDANSASLGQDGLGGLTGQPDEPSATAGDFIGSEQGVTAGLIHFETDSWKPRSFTASLLPATAMACDGTDGETTVFSPPVPLVCDLGGQNSFYIGNLKYWRVVGSTATSKTIKPVPGSNQGYLHVKEVNAATNNHFCLITDKTKTP